MSDVRPFRALRPRSELAERVAAPPYDVINSDEAREMAKGNEISFLHINKPEIDLPPEVSLYDDRVYAKGVANLRRFIAEGVFVREPEPRFYVYQQRMGNHVQAGIVGAASCREYADGLIKRHEFTRKDKEDDRTRHTHELNANAGPVFLTYRKRAEIDAIVDGIRKGQPLYDIVTSDGIGHTVWAVSAGETAALQQAIRSVPALYVADGHHRAASAARVGLERKAGNPRHRGDEPYNYFLAVLFPHDQLRIMDYNRVVKDLAGLTPDAFLARIAGTFTVSDTREPRPDAAHRFGMYLGGRWRGLEAKPGTFPGDDPVRSLDAAILQENLLAPVLGITDPRTDKRVDFVGGIRGVGELEKRVAQGWAVAFALFPASLEQLMAVADAGLVMPPKSTWFEPKLRSGLLVRTLDTW
ncbi:MAG: hypothetical protein B7Z68_09415 [Acidobacteria bacterium 21-70-11]|nr:MAG: hypothetical protein B7Z68_09415 [Acidobacteria bacterium 21-70-11]OYW05254.1 MAG: hypothetical protein B7Z61_06880 [Acidobacteria bacterium 37-71-11]HQU33514.1 DUF1015 family protein [Thermoanaerobaculaceae bacterium]